jgi:hypothetical protein
MVITDLPSKIPGLDACAACVAAKLVHLPHRKGCERATDYLDLIHIDVTGPMPVKSARGKEGVCVCGRRRLRLRSLHILGIAADEWRVPPPIRNCIRERHRPRSPKSCTRQWRRAALTKRDRHSFTVFHSSDNPSCRSLNNKTSKRSLQCCRQKLLFHSNTLYHSVSP